MSGQDNPLDRNSKVHYDNFMLDINSVEKNVNLEELATKFELDVVTDANGAFVTQGNKVIRKPYDVSSSTRKINEQLSAFPSGFSMVFYATKINSAAFSNPREPIPSGCFCTVCEEFGPNGHLSTCSFPNHLSLNLTLKGFVECVYSPNKTYRNRLLANTNVELRKTVDLFVARVQELSESYEDLTSNECNEIYIKAAVETNAFDLIRFKIFEIPPDPAKVTDPGKVTTNIKCETVRNIPGLKKGKMNYTFGSTLIQYTSVFDGTPKRSSIRVYGNGKIVIIPCIWDKKKSYELMITEILERINRTGVDLIPIYAFIPVANGAFRLIPELVEKGINLAVFYQTFHPTDEAGNRLLENDYMKTVEYTQEGGGEVVRRFVQEGRNKYEFTISEEGRGKLSMSFIKYEDNKPSIYKITSQIYNTGIVQMIFSYKDQKEKDVKRKLNASEGIDEINQQIELQTIVIKEHFELIRRFIVGSIDKMVADGLEIFEPKVYDKLSDNVHPTVSGTIPQAKKINQYAGYIVDFYDDTKDEWKDNFGWCDDDSERGVIVKVLDKSMTRFDIIVGEPRLETLLEPDTSLELEGFVIKSKHEAPLVTLENGEQAYLIEDYVEGAPQHWVISGEPEEFHRDFLRIHKQSVNDTKPYTKDSQVAVKTFKGMSGRPVPYSFYGQCDGGHSQYVDRIGVQYRRDNRFYPSCSEVTDKNRKQVQDEAIDFLLNGLTPEQLEDGNISSEIEVIHGIPIKDKNAGTFKPGTIDIGNIITFWDEASEQWLDGTLFDYKKSHGPGGDKNFTTFHLRVLDEEYSVSGEQFHPKHREARNFPGLNNLVPDENMRKEFLINCAKKLNLVKADIQIEKTSISVQTSVLKKLGQITGNGSFLSVVNGTNPFIEKNIMELTKTAYEAVIVPDDGTRCILFVVDQKEQYLIDSYDKVRQVSVNFDQDIGVDGTIVDGFINEKKDYFPFDLLYLNGVKLHENYLYDNDDEETGGRLVRLQQLVNSISTMKSPNSITVKKPLGNYGTRSIFKGNVQIHPFIGPIDPNVSLIQFVKENRRSNNDIMFIPQTGGSNYIIWKHFVTNNPIVVQVLKQDTGRDSWIVGLIEHTSDGISKPWKLLKLPIVLTKINDENGEPAVIKKNDFIRIRLNIMINGTINELNPYINPVKVSKNEASTFEETKIAINLITRSIKEEVFQNAEKWELAKVQKVLIPDESSRLPLKEKIYRYLTQEAD